LCFKVSYNPTRGHYLQTDELLMRQPMNAPYGSWKSPITSDLIVAENIWLGGPIILDRDEVYWVELRPAEAGRCVIVKHASDGHVVDVTPKSFNARTRVHEYGGGTYVVAEGTVYFSNFRDQRLYKQEPDIPPVPISPDTNFRYADFVFDKYRERIICVREDHTSSDRQAVNSIVSVNPGLNDGGEVIVSGNDFYSSPRISPDGTRLAWLTWNHPNMPWDGTEVWVSRFKDNGTLGQPTRVAGGVSESVFQPEWSPDNVLYFISDPSGWWNLYRWREDISPSRIEPLHEAAWEFGLPQWVFGLSTYGFESIDRIICTYIKQSSTHMAILNTESGRFDPIKIPFSEIRSLRAASGRVLFIAGSPVQPSAIVQYDIRDSKIQILRRESDALIDPGYLSAPEEIEFPTANGLTAFGLYYRPKNRDYVATADTKPPLMIISHGGPTGAAHNALSLENIQYWTSRGIAVCNVNYGGSTGYGRAYRERLRGKWGIVDVDDCANAARYLVDRGQADGNRLIIRGGSAGGYTTLAALTFRNIFKAGASYYGVSDLEALATDTHKFESRYMDSMIGPYPEKRDLYMQRSPIHFTNRLASPIIFFQGLEDKIVPPDQAVKMFEAIRSKRIPTAYVPFEGEQHGFRKAENIKRALEAELYFYSKVFSFQLAEQVEPVQIENMP
jgi:dipeptidyl aminopeptidase/acylaminoacyl peptidase